MPLLYLFIIALSQFYVSWMMDQQLFDYEAFFYGNLQVLVILFVYDKLNKYIKF